MIKDPWVVIVLPGGPALMRQKPDHVRRNIPRGFGDFYGRCSSEKEAADIVDLMRRAGDRATFGHVTQLESKVDDAGFVVYRATS